MIGFERDDGGRAGAGFKGSTGDCVVRAICILTGRDYRETYDLVASAVSSLGDLDRNGNPIGRTARRGASSKALDFSMRECGLVRHSLGRGVKPTYSEAHERFGDCIVKTRGHVCAIVDGKLRDTFDGRGYWWDPNLGIVLGDDKDAPPAQATIGLGQSTHGRWQPVGEWRERKATSVWTLA